MDIVPLVLSLSYISKWWCVCVCSSGAAWWPAAESELETGRLPAGFLLQGDDNSHCTTYSPYIATTYIASLCVTTAKWKSCFSLFTTSSFLCSLRFGCCSCSVWPLDAASGPHSAQTASHWTLLRVICLHGVYFIKMSTGVMLIKRVGITSHIWFRN